MQCCFPLPFWDGPSVTQSLWFGALESWSGWEYTSHYDDESGEWIHDSTLVSSSADVTTVGGLTVSSGGRVTGLVAQSLPGLDEYSNIYSPWPGSGLVSRGSQGLRSTLESRRGSLGAP